MCGGEVGEHLLTIHKEFWEAKQLRVCLEGSFPIKSGITSFRSALREEVSSASSLSSDLLILVGHRKSIIAWKCSPYQITGP